MLRQGCGYVDVNYVAFEFVFEFVFVQFECTLTLVYPHHRWFYVVDMLLWLRAAGVSPSECIRGRSRVFYVTSF